MNWRHWGALLVLVLGWGFLAASRLPEAHAQRVAPAQSGELQSHVTTVNERLQVLTLVDPVSRQVCVYHLDTTTGIMTLKSARQVQFDLQLKEYNTGNPLPSEIRNLLEQR